MTTHDELLAAWDEHFGVVQPTTMNLSRTNDEERDRDSEPILCHARTFHIPVPDEPTEVLLCPACGARTVVETARRSGDPLETASGRSVPNLSREDCRRIVQLQRLVDERPYDVAAQIELRDLEDDERRLEAVDPWSKREQQARIKALSSMITASAEREIFLTRELEQHTILTRRSAALGGHDEHPRR